MARATGNDQAIMESNQQNFAAYLGQYGVLNMILKPVDSLGTKFNVILFLQTEANDLNFQHIAQNICQYAFVDNPKECSRSNLVIETSQLKLDGVTKVAQMAQLSIIQMFQMEYKTVEPKPDPVPEPEPVVPEPVPEVVPVVVPVEPVVPEVVPEVVPQPENDPSIIPTSRLSFMEQLFMD